jgi:hypothetical protein
MVGKLSRLPVETPESASGICLPGQKGGAPNAADGLRGFKPMNVRLWEAVRAGLIFRSEDSYGFLRDRVQEAPIP